jgi:hypothetical protein
MAFFGETIARRTPLPLVDSKSSTSEELIHGITRQIWDDLDSLVDPLIEDDDISAAFPQKITANGREYDALIVVDDTVSLQTEIRWEESTDQGESVVHRIRFDQDDMPHLMVENKPPKLLQAWREVAGVTDLFIEPVEAHLSPELLGRVAQDIRQFRQTVAVQA